LSKGAVYWHFKSKPELLTELVVRMTKLHTEELGRVLSEPASLGELRAHFIHRADFVVQKPINRKFFRMMTRLDWSAARFAPVKRRLHQLENGIFSVIRRTLGSLQAQGAVRADVDVPTVTAVLGAMWLGLIKARTDQCLEAGLGTAVAAGFDMIISVIRK
jgi:AcrR family transcriptional regulator